MPQTWPQNQSLPDLWPDFDVVTIKTISHMVIGSSIAGAPTQNPTHKTRPRCGCFQNRFTYGDRVLNCRGPPTHNPLPQNSTTMWLLSKLFHIWWQGPQLQGPTYPEPHPQNSTSMWSLSKLSRIRWKCPQLQRPSFPEPQTNLNKTCQHWCYFQGYHYNKPYPTGSHIPWIS